MAGEKAVGEKAEDQHEGKSENVWEDVTSRFQSIVSTLSTGELLHPEDFNLYESMTAIELGQKSMDAGMRCNWMSREEIEAPDPESLSLGQIIGITDVLLAVLKVQYSGSCLHHTVFPCVFYHNRTNPTGPNSELLALIMDAVLVNGLFSIQVILKSQHFEEEDFHLPQAPKEPNTTTLAKGLKIETALIEHLKLFRSKKRSNVRQALGSRLEFLLLLLQLNKALSPPADKSGYSQIYKFILEAERILEAIKGTTKIGTSSEEFFDERLMRPAIPHQPPRKWKIPDKERAVEDWRNWFLTIRRVWEVALKPKCIIDLLDRLRFFSAQDPDTTLRALMKLLVVDSSQKNKTFLTSGLQHSVVAEDSLRLFCPGARAFVKNGRNFMAQFPIFMEQYLNMLTRIYRFWVSNRSRQLLLAEPILTDLGVLQQVAGELDRTNMADLLQAGGNEQNSKPSVSMHNFSLCIVNLTFHIVLEVFHRNFELDLYHPTELPIAFWYLQHLGNMSVLAFEQAGKPFELSYPKEKPKYVKKRRKLEKRLAAKDSNVWNRDQYPEAQIVRGLSELSKGLWALIQAWRMIGVKWDGFKASKYGSEELMFGNRYAMFHHLPFPSPAQFGQYKMGLQVFSQKNKTPQAAVNVALPYLKAIKPFVASLLKKYQGFLDETTERNLRVLSRKSIINCMACIKTLMFLRNPDPTKELVITTTYSSLWDFIFIAESKPKPESLENIRQ